MTPRHVIDFFKSKFGLFCVFLALLLGGVLWYGSRQKGQPSSPVAGQKKAEVGRMRIPLDNGIKAGLPEKADEEKSLSKANLPGGQLVPLHLAPVAATAPLKALATAESHDGLSVKSVEPPRPLKSIKIRALLVKSTVKPEPAHAPAVPARFVPYGTLLKCKLVNTVDSANTQTPIIAELLEDIWQNGELVIPANTLLHGMAQKGRLRDRVNASGAWRLVWQDGRQLGFSGVALDREYAHDIDGYGITDGSAGLRGRVIATDDLQELKLLTAAALSGFARGTQDRTSSVLGTTMVGSTSNGLREGAGEVFDLYAKRVLKDLEENGYFVRVAAGKEFYLYVLGVLDPAKATIAGQAVDEPGRAQTTRMTPGELPPEIKTIFDKKEG